MSWLEWWGESIDPGRRGSVGMADLSGPRRVHPVVTIFKFGLTFAAFVAVPLVGVFSSGEPVPVHGLYALGSLFAYVLVSTVFRPEPDYSNMGWMGGLMDNPFRYSDDWNRTLFWLLILTGPGRLLGSGVVDMFHLLAGEE